MNKHLGPEDHAELQRMMALTAGDATEAPGTAPMKRLPDDGVLGPHELKKLYYAGGRRRNYLVQQIADEGSRGPRGRDFDRLELSFVEAGLEALRFWERHGRTAEEAVANARRLCSATIHGDELQKVFDDIHDWLDRFDGVGD